MSWRRLRSLVAREVRATYRDSFTMCILVAVPLVGLLLFGFVLATDVTGLGVGILDADGSTASRRLVADLAADGAFTPRRYASREALEHALRSGAIGAAVIIPPAFTRARARVAAGGERPTVQVGYDGAEAVLAGNAEGALRGLLATTAAVALRTPARGALPGCPTAAAGPAPAGGVAVVSHALFNPSLAGKPFMVSGTFGWVLSFLATLITAVAIVNERLSGTFEQLCVTPATTLEILLGKIVPLGAVFALDVALMALVAGAALGVWPAGSMLFFLVVSTAYVLISLSVGLIISATSSTAAEAVQKSVLFSIPLVILSGFAFPVRNMPTVIRWMAELFPATHYIRISRAIYLRGEGPLDLAGELGILALFGLALGVVALRALGARQ